jgi:hypothetical protein
MSVIRFVPSELAPIATCATAAGVERDRIFRWLVQADAGNRRAFAQRYGEITPAASRSELEALSDAIPPTKRTCLRAAQRLSSLAGNSEGDIDEPTRQQVEAMILAHVAGGAPASYAHLEQRARLGRLRHDAEEVARLEQRRDEYETAKATAGALKPYTPPEPRYDPRPARAGAPVESYPTKDAAARIKAALKARTGQTWSVTSSGHSITIQPPPARRECDGDGHRVTTRREYERRHKSHRGTVPETEEAMSYSCAADRKLLARALAMDPREIPAQGHMTLGDPGCYEELVARAEGRTPTRWCRPNFDR